MKKIFIVMFGFILLISSGMFLSACADRVHPDEMTDEELNQYVMSIKNENTKKAILDLYYGQIFGIVAYSDGQQIENEEGIGSDDQEESDYNEEIIKLSKLSGEDLEREVTAIVEKLILDNKDRTGIYWNEDFLENYVAQYCPQYLEEYEFKTRSDFIDLENELIGE